MLIGQKGVKYGLTTRKDEKKPQPAPGRLAAFGGDSDSDEDNIEAQVARQAARKVADHKVTASQRCCCMISLSGTWIKR
jgi:hypothetical protein